MRTSCVFYPKALIESSRALFRSDRRRNCFDTRRFMSASDTSTTHVAAAVGVPVLALFGPTSACHWGPAPSAGSRNFANHVSLQRSKTVTSRRIPTTPTVVNAVPDTRRVVRARATRVSRCASRRCRRTSWSRKSTAFWQAVPTRRSPSAPGLRIFPRNRTEKTVARRPGTV